MSDIKHILSVIHYTIYEAVCFQFTHLLCDDIESVYFVLLSSLNRKDELSPIVMKQWYALYVSHYSLTMTELLYRTFVSIHIQLEHMGVDSAL